MHRWKIDNKKIWLCNACMRQLTDIIMLGTWKWLDESRDRYLYCDRCKCNDSTGVRFGRLRRFFRFFVQQQPRYGEKSKAHRRAL